MPISRRSRRIWSMSRRADGSFDKAQLLQMPLRFDLSSFGEDESGELYALSLTGNVVYRITPGL